MTGAYNPLAEVEPTAEPYPVAELVVVDLETTGTNAGQHDVVEIAWWNLTTGERDAFVPLHDPNDVLLTADLGALAINRYIERGLYARADTDDPDGHRLANLYDQLAGGDDPHRTTPADRRRRALLTGKNPWFDAAFLAHLWGREPWNYQLRDIGNYAAGVLGIPLDEPLGLSDICERLGVPLAGHHCAEADVTATGMCVLELQRLADHIATAWKVVPHG